MGGKQTLGEIEKRVRTIGRNDRQRANTRREEEGGKGRKEDKDKQGDGEY